MQDTIEHILSEERLVVHFQPIISPTGRALFGFESLIRGIDQNGDIIPPLQLFKAAKQYNKSFELDKLARTLAIKAFKPIWETDNKLILFVNFEPKLIDSFEPGNYLFYGELTKAGIPYNNIVLEVKEDEISNTDKLKDFCAYYRALGFNIALDDFGVGQSSFDRIALVRPDIIKIDRSLITDITNNQIHQEVVHAICNMCQNIGALPLAEGVETLDETVCSLSHGAVLMQGFYFAKPSTNPIDQYLNSKINDVHANYLALLKEQQTHIIKINQLGATIEDHVKTLLSSLDNLHDWQIAASPLLDKCPSIEALYLIDSNDKQVGNTLIKNQTRPLYEPTRHGHDYSLKAYHIRVKNSANGKHLTRPYLSMASGSLCRTFSSRTIIAGVDYVLCIDFKVSQ